MRIRFGNIRLTLRGIRDGSRCGRRTAWLWAAGALAWAAGSVAMADQPVPAGDPGRTGEPGYFQPGYYANGKFHQLLVSPNELAVELADPQERASAATRARTGGIGVLEEVPWGARDGKFAILRVLDEATAARARVRELPEFVSVNPVYRHAADGPPILSSGRIVVKLVAGLTPADQEELFESYRVDWGRAVPGLANVHLVAPRGQADNLELVTAAALYRDPAYGVCPSRSAFACRKEAVRRCRYLRRPAVVSREYRAKWWHAWSRYRYLQRIPPHFRSGRALRAIG
jgi:hypothetical protein